MMMTKFKLVGNYDFFDLFKMFPFIFLGASLSLVNCPTRWSLYCHLGFCFDHLVGGWDLIKAPLDYSDHCWELKWPFWTIFLQNVFSIYMWLSQEKNWLRFWLFAPFPAVFGCVSFFVKGVIWHRQKGIIAILCHKFYNFWHTLQHFQWDLYLPHPAK